MDGWNTTFLLVRPILRGCVSFGEGMSLGCHPSLFLGDHFCIITIAPCCLKRWDPVILKSSIVMPLLLFPHFSYDLLGHGGWKSSPKNILPTGGETWWWNPMTYLKNTPTKQIQGHGWFFFACGGHSVVKGPVEIIPVRYPRNSSTSRNHPSHLHVVPSWREQLVMGYANNFWNAGLLAFYKLGTQKHMGLEA